MLYTISTLFSGSNIHRIITIEYNSSHQRYYVKFEYPLFINKKTLKPVSQVKQFTSLRECKDYVSLFGLTSKELDYLQSLKPEDFRKE